MSFDRAGAVSKAPTSSRGSFDRSIPTEHRDPIEWKVNDKRGGNARIERASSADKEYHWYNPWRRIAN